VKENDPEGEEARSPLVRSYAAERSSSRTAEEKTSPLYPSSLGASCFNERSPRHR